MPRTINTAIEAVPLNLLKPHPRNVNQGDFGAIQQSVETNGFYGTIVANKRTGHILAGNHRYAVAKAMNYTDVPVAWVDVDDEQELRILIADNRTTRLGIDNEASLTELLAELAATPTGLTGTGFDGDDLDALISSVTGADKPELLTDPDDVPDDAPTRCNPGDLWQLGNHRLLCGDSTKTEDVELLMAGSKVDLLLSDPPYGVDYDGIINDDAAGLPNLLRAAMSQADRLMRCGACYYICHPDVHAYEFICVVRERGWRQARPPVIVWVKDRFVLGRGDYHSQSEPILYGWKEGASHHAVQDRTQSNVWQFDRPSSADGHPTMKPVGLFARAVQNSTNSGDLIYDPFLGSGTTLIAAEQLGRKCYGIEISPKYCDVIIERWERATGKTAVLLEAGNGTTD